MIMQLTVFLENSEGRLAALCRTLADAGVNMDALTIAEDMSYNNGPMLSEAQFDEFLLPYYREMIPAMRERGTRVFIDSDGDITLALPWFARAGIEGILPLERLIDLMVFTPRKRFGIPLGEEDYTVWDLEREDIVDPQSFLSLGKATPFAGRRVFGRCVKTVHAGRTVYPY